MVITFKLLSLLILMDQQMEMNHKMKKEEKTELIKKKTFSAALQELSNKMITAIYMTNTGISIAVFVLAVSFFK